METATGSEPGLRTGHPPWQTADLMKTALRTQTAQVVLI